MGLKRRNVRGINEKENNKIEICASEENKEDVKEATTEKVELANDMIKTPIEPINELTDTIEEDTNVEEVAEDLNTEKDDIAKIIEEENNN